MQEQPAAVPARAKQAGELIAPQARRARWAWAKASVWTDRMLAALEDGVKGDVWFSLMDKVYNPKNQWSAWAKSAANDGSPGVDGITIERYEKDVESNLTRLAEKLKDGSYHPKAIRRTFIPKGAGKMRPLGIPSVEDRIVQGAVRHVIEPTFEKQSARHSYGFRPGRGCKDALRRVDELLKAGYPGCPEVPWRSRLPPYSNAPVHCGCSSPRGLSDGVRKAPPCSGTFSLSRSTNKEGHQGQ